MANTRISSETGIDKVKDGTITQASLAAPFYLPSPQTWQTVTGSRVLGTAYTNTTGQPIKFAVIFNPASSILQLVVSGLTVAYVIGTAGAATSLYAEVPAGATYSASSSAGTLNTWAELR